MVRRLARVCHCFNFESVDFRFLPLAYELEILRRDFSGSVTRTTSFATISPAISSFIHPLVGRGCGESP
ncbi:hypothetical protein TWF706_001090 [Orbilia oligospora]|nr:hypothetical protein TWF706_001090 [Orbilia oligospora]KAF3090226.1 hypothetical protein TWF103_011951 [Orbilia oligospora]